MCSSAADGVLHGLELETHCFIGCVMGQFSNSTKHHLYYAWFIMQNIFNGNRKVTYVYIRYL